MVRRNIKDHYSTDWTFGVKKKVASSPVAIHSVFATSHIFLLRTPQENTMPWRRVEDAALPGRGMPALGDPRQQQQHNFTLMAMAHLNYMEPHNRKNLHALLFMMSITWLLVSWVSFTTSAWRLSTALLHQTCSSP